jgi:oligoribonuclease (3'-5' exoribonuclease)
MIIWTDTETSGLNERGGHLLEVALVVTDDSLNEVAATSEVVRPVGKSIDDVEMDDVVRKMHTKNGLIAEIKKLEALPYPESEEFRLYKVEQRLANFLQAAFVGVPDIATHTCVKCKQNEKDHVVMDDVLRCLGLVLGQEVADPFAPKMLTALSQTPFAGSTVSFDRRWLREHMPLLEKQGGYRSIDVSTITELAKRWAPEVYKCRPGADKTKEEGEHRALPDVRESINYLRYYRKCGFIGGCL